MKSGARTKISAPACACVISALTFALPACSTPLADRGPEGTGKASAPAAVTTARPLPVPEDDGFASSLYVERDVILSARTTGIIEKVLVDRGDRVKAGQALAVIESDLAERDLEIAGQNERLADAEFKRIAPLHDQAIVSSQDYLQAQIDLEQARSKVQLARSLLERCTSRAPFDGIVVERWAVAGQRVQEDDGTPLFRVMANEPLRARVNVPEELLRSLKVGGAAEVKCLSEEESHPARIVFVSPAIDPGSGTAPVIVETKHRGDSPRAGASARVRFTGGAAGTAYRLPREALSAGTGDGEGTAVIRVVSDGRAVSRRVRVRETRGSYAIVEGQIGPDDQVILAGEAIAEGADVTVVGQGR